MEGNPNIVACPKCHEQFEVTAVLRRKAETVVTYELTLEPGHMVSASAVGESISAD